MRTVLKVVLATLMLTALTGCVELNRESETRASTPPTPGFESLSMALE